MLIGVPKVNIDLGDAQAVVIALKSRTIPAKEAIDQSLEALAWLQDQSAQQFFFKYCSQNAKFPLGVFYNLYTKTFI